MRRSMPELEKGKRSRRIRALLHHPPGSTAKKLLSREKHKKRQLNTSKSRDGKEV